MNFLILSMIGLLVIQSAVFSFGGTASNTSQASANIDIEAANHRVFVFVAQRYVSSNPFTGDAITTINWAQITSPASGADTQHFQRYTLPPTWNIRGNQDNWVVCTPMSPQARLKLASTFEPTPPISGSNRLPVSYSMHPWCLQP